jgi:VWFA-related protein
VIVLTDGGDGGSHISRSNLLLKLQETDTLIYPVQFTTERSRAMEHILRTGKISARDAAQLSGKYKTKADLKAERAADVLKEVALVSAGRFLASDADRLKDAFTSILDELRRQYRLGFYPPETDTGNAVHEIKVGVSRRDLIIRCRSSYRRPSE